MEITVQEGLVRLRLERVSAEVAVDQVQIAHMGCKLLGSLKQVPKDLVAAWDSRFGGRSSWKLTGPAVVLGQALVRTLEQSELHGATLWDTMRNGSDFWRPGKLLRETASAVSDLGRGLSLSYAREDVLCPSSELLKEFRDSQEMPFGEFASRYAEELKQSHAVEQAAAAVVLELARGRLPVFYCTDPYIPDYGQAEAMRSTTDYRHREWLSALRLEGCHRVVLAEELVRLFQSGGVPVKLFEVDQLSEDGCHVREFDGAR